MYSILKRFLFALDPETAHGFVKTLGKTVPKRLLDKATRVEDAVLKASIGEAEISNPIGLAAGFDKNGEMVNFLSALGFGYLELGSVTAQPCAGNPRPRIFRLPKDESLINRMGLPNVGAERFSAKVSKMKTRVPCGINIAKNPFMDGNRSDTLKTARGVEEYVRTFVKVAQLGAYFVLNLSCPNTGDGKTFEDPRTFVDLAREILEARKDLHVSKPVLIKLSPDIEKKQLTALIESALKYGFEGFVAGNSTMHHPHLKTEGSELKKIGRGGLTGHALLVNSNRQLKSIHEITGNAKIIVGVGGIMGVKDLLLKLSLGASLFQVYTGLVYRGPFFIRDLNRGLTDFCRKRGVANYIELRGLKEIASGL
ncbi:MAG: quinone-dependent dihydroorotate dehydrogenase [Deltaproteobacteria bacterium]|nr:quinone-dependent dihydroorotate dehydrogenase [Deltaproteobacteria bacterium]